MFIFWKTFKVPYYVENNIIKNYIFLLHTEPVGGDN